VHNQPSVAELLQAVKNFIDETAGPQLKGHAAFHARVASNALSTVLRDLESRDGSEDDEITRLQVLLSTDETELETLNRTLSERIQSGQLTALTPGLFEHLKTTTIAQVEIDQPRYSGLKTAKT